NVLAARADPPVYDDAWDPFWALAQELDVPVAFHLAVDVRRGTAGAPHTDNHGDAGLSAGRAVCRVDLQRNAGPLSQGAPDHGGSRARLGAAYDPELRLLRQAPARGPRLNRRR